MSHFTLLSAFVTAGVVLAVYVAYELLQRAFRAHKSPLGNIPGPKSVNLLRGSFTHDHEFDTYRLMEQWIDKYGHTFKYTSFFGTNKLVTVDIKALSHILSHPVAYEKSKAVRFNLGELLGKGLLFVEGAEHRQQRKIMSPAFGTAQIRQFTEIFMQKANELRSIWMSEVARTSRKDGRLQLDAFAWLNKVTLDIIGLAGFNYDFGTLYAADGKPDELNEAVRTMFSFKTTKISFLLQLLFPLARVIPTERSREVSKSLHIIRRVGTKMIADKKAAVLNNASGGVEKKDVEGRDLLSLLIKSNMATDIPDSARMNDEEILSQVPTFLVAGHETTSTGVAWALFALAGHPAAQNTLRAELLEYPTDQPTMEQLNSLSYLDAVVREVMRIHAPVGSTERVAVQDDVIPLENELTDRNGVKRKEIRVAEGDIITIPIRAINRSTELWGEDAHQFKPERWVDLPEAVRNIPSIWSNTLSFLSGSHACIGYRFSIIEMKALLFAIVRSFEFELAVEPEDIIRRTNVVGRPFIDSNIEAGSQLPLLIRPVQA